GVYFFFFQAEDGIRDFHVTGVQTCALPIWSSTAASSHDRVRRGASRLPRSRADLPGAGDRSVDLLQPCGPGGRSRGTSGSLVAEIGRASCRERVAVAVAGR